MANFVVEGGAENLLRLTFVGPALTPKTCAAPFAD
jgi:hypothetical protein